MPDILARILSERSDANCVTWVCRSAVWLLFIEVICKPAIPNSPIARTKTAIITSTKLNPFSVFNFRYIIIYGHVIFVELPSSIVPSELLSMASLALPVLFTTIPFALVAPLLSQSLKVSLNPIAIPSEE